MAYDKNNVTLALDRSVRTYDADGRLHVSVANISKANVCPYYGREIPNWQALGLDSEKVYQLFRDPDELKKAAHTSNNIQIMGYHTAVSADEPMKEVVIGTSGTDGTFDDPYLTNSLAFWDADAIALIEADEQRELSCGYRYEADMTPGISFAIHYDGVMRNIIFNHIALVTEGRAGPDVVVGDSKLESETVKKLQPRKSARAKAIILAVDGKLADDAAVLAMDAELEKMDADDEADAEKKAEDEAAEAKKAEDEAAEAAAKKDAMDEDMDDKKAMDAKIAKSVTAETAKGIAAAMQAYDAKHRDIDIAKTVVRPHVGEVTGAYDSADEIYALALDAAEVDHKGVSGLGLKRMVEMLGRSAAADDTVHAYDAAAVSGNPFAELTQH